MEGDSLLAKAQAGKAREEDGLVQREREREGEVEKLLQIISCPI